MPSFSGKEQLLRSASLINLNNYEAWFLSYIDDELDPASRQAVIDFVRQHPEKNIELHQLQRTVNAPDPGIVFPDKELLYRREPARTRKIAWLPFARIAAAALILGAAGLLIFHPFRNGQSVVSGPGNIGTSGHSDPRNTASVTLPDSNNIAPAPVLVKTAPLSTEKKRPAPVTPRTVDPYYIQKKKDKQSLPTEDNTVAPVMARTDGTAHPEVVAQADPARPAKVDPARPAKTVDTDPSRDLAVAVPKTIDRNVKIPVTMAAAGDQAQHDATGNMNTSFASRALLSQTSYPDDGSPEEIVSPRKNKLRGIFRKVTRVLEKPAAREDDDNKKVTIGGFQFALK